MSSVIRKNLSVSDNGVNQDLGAASAGRNYIPDFYNSLLGGSAESGDVVGLGKTRWLPHWHASSKTPPLRTTIGLDNRPAGTIIGTS